jgi:hypothetical protein
MIRIMIIFFILMTLLIENMSLAMESSDLKKKEKQVSIQAYILGGSARLESSENQELKNYYYTSSAIGYRQDNWSSLFEVSYLNDKSGNSSSNILRNHKDMILWGRYHFYSLLKDSWRSSLFTGLGLGMFQEEIQTNFMTSHRTDKLDGVLTSGFVVGGDAALHITAKFAVALSIELRALESREFQPNPLLDEALRLGISFNL